MSTSARTPRSLSSPLRAFLAQLRERRGADARRNAVFEDASAVVRQVARDSDLIARFVASAAAAGIRVETVQSISLAARLVDVLGATSVKRAYFEPPLERWGDAIARMHRAGIEVTDAASDEVLFTVGASVTSAWRAVAETGSIVVAAGERVARGASLIVPLHVAVIPAGRVLADLVDLFDELERLESMPSNVNIITGASKTADIEGQLVTGVHGPGRVVAVVVLDA